MGQNCCSQTTQRQYNIERKIRNQQISKQNTQNTNIPDNLQTALIPNINKEVRQAYQIPFKINLQNKPQGVPGEPKIIGNDGTIYAGEWKQMMPNGKGIMYFADGSLYEGIFNEGTPDREGRLITNNGVYYVGQVSNAQASGSGKLVNKYIKYDYVGEWLNDMPNGNGKQKWDQDIYYEGRFVKGIKQGSGKYVSKGQFQYDGVFDNNSINRIGKAIFNNGDIYEGSWKNGYMDGFGIYTWKDGSHYYGNFQKGKKDGKGKYTDARGAIFEGMWKDGKRNGKGILKVPEFDDIIQWEWRNDLPVQSK